MDEMNIGQCLDYVQEWIDNNSEDGTKQQKSRKANQNDFDAF